IDLDLGPRPLAEQHTVADLEIDRDQLAGLVPAPGADGNDLSLLRLLLGGIGDDDAAGSLLFGFDARHNDAIVQWTELHWLLPSVSFFSQASRGAEPSRVALASFPPRQGPRLRATTLQSPTSYRNHLAGNPCGAVRGEENHGFGDIRALGPSLQIFGFHRGNIRSRIHKSGCHGIHSDSEISSFQRQRARESLDSRLGAVIRHHVRLGESGTPEVDDGATSSVPHGRENRPRSQKSAEKVIVQFVIPIFQAVLDCGLVASKASCEIDQDVNLFVLTQDALYQLAHLGFISQSRGHGKHMRAGSAQLFSSLLHVALRTRTNRERGAVLCEYF